MLANLPGVSGPWLHQYAHRLAQDLGPTLLIHADHDTLDLELARPAGDHQTPPLEGVASLRPSTHDDVAALIAALIDHPTRPVRHILLHLQPDACDTLLTSLASFERWSLLTGCDDMAVAAAGVLIHDLTDHLPDAAAKSVGVITVGGDADQATRARARIQAAAGHRLRHELQLRGHHRRFEPLHLQHIGSFQPVLERWPEIQHVLIERRVADPPRPAVVSHNAHDTQNAPRNPRRDPTQASSDTQTTLNAPPPVMDTPPRPAAVPPREMPLPEPSRDSSPPRPATASHADRPSLSSLLDTQRGPLAGAVALHARCPNYADIELMLDRHGALHLLAAAAEPQAPRPFDDDQASAAFAACRSAILDLTAVRRWVIEHRDLLALTLPAARFDPSTEPVVHLFVDRGDLAGSLITKLGPALKLHLLQHLPPNGPAWFCTPLS